MLLELADPELLAAEEVVPSPWMARSSLFAVALILVRLHLLLRRHKRPCPNPQDVRMVVDEN